MYELNNKIRLIDTSAYPITNSDEFIGFICGILSQDNDLEQMYLDSFLKIANLENADADRLEATVEKLGRIGETYHVTFVLSISMDKDELPEKEKEKVIVSL